MKIDIEKVRFACSATNDMVIPYLLGQSATHRVLQLLLNL
jgi:hypothetical protein